MLTSRIHRRKPEGKPMARATACAAKSAIRARIDPSTGSGVFAHQKNRFGLFIRTIGIKRAEAKMILANRAYTFDLRRTFLDVGNDYCGIDLLRIKMLMQHSLKKDVTTEHYMKRFNLEKLAPVIQQIQFARSGLE